MEKCYTIFAELLDPSLTPSLSSIQAILNEVALQDPRAKKLTPKSLVEIV
jgi:hypothetical protein